MAHDMDHVKSRIMTRNKEDPELDAAMIFAREATAQEAKNNLIIRYDMVLYAGTNITYKFRQSKSLEYLRHQCS